MRSYFKTLFRDNTINSIIGQYDQFNDVFMLNIKYNDNQYLTWIYSDKNNGWLGTQTFNPEDMIRLKGDFYTFKNGEVYLHNQEVNGVTPNYNIFYGVSYPSEASFNFSQNPEIRKNYKTIELDGTDAWAVALQTNLDSGYINIADFEKKEGIYYGYVRYDNGVVDTALLSFQGIGTCQINGLTLDFDFNLDPIISVGDLILNSNLQVIGTILSKTANSLIMNTVNNIVDGDFVLSSKPNSVQQQSILGYYCKVTITLEKNERTELFSVSSEISKSFM